mmetsp:Transcript_11967/g.25634  ORF Transcript_11967/g.25634 Transcript_11967/m.25634 type:complete len:236 (+) Transcript_11967:209-916(+)
MRTVSANGSITGPVNSSAKGSLAATSAGGGVPPTPGARGAKGSPTRSVPEAMPEATPNKPSPSDPDASGSPPVADGSAARLVTSRALNSEWSGSPDTSTSGPWPLPPDSLPIDLSAAPPSASIDSATSSTDTAISSNTRSLSTLDGTSAVVSGISRFGDALACSCLVPPSATRSGGAVCGSDGCCSAFPPPASMSDMRMAMASASSSSSTVPCGAGCCPGCCCTPGDCPAGGDAI